MFRNRFFRKIFHYRLVDIDQVKLVYIKIIYHAKRYIDF